MEPKITIITPTLCRAKFLPILHQMVSSQTYQHTTWIILEEKWSYEQHNTLLPNTQFCLLDVPDGHVCSISQKINIGFQIPEVQSADIVFKMDSDNYFGSDYISKYVDFMMSRPQCMLSFAKSDILYNIVEREYGVLQVVQDGNICCRRSLLDKVRLHENIKAGELGEDAWFIWDTQAAYGPDAVCQNAIDIYKDYMVIKHTPKVQQFTNYQDYQPYVYPTDIAKQKILNGNNLCTYDVSNIPDIDCKFLSAIVEYPTVLEFYKSFYQENTHV